MHESMRVRSSIYGMIMVRDGLDYSRERDGTKALGNRGDTQYIRIIYI